MSKQSTVKAIHHSHKVIGLTKQLIDLKILRVVHKARFDLMPDMLSQSTDRRDAMLRNLWIYARIGLNLDPEHILEVFDAETDQLIAQISHAEVTYNPSYTFT